MKHGIMIAAVLILVLTLTACGRTKITAESLIDGAEGKKPSGSTVTATIAYDLVMAMNISDNAEQPYYMETQMRGNINIKGDNRVSYTKSQVGASIMGVSNVSSVEQWSEINGDTEVSYYSEDGKQWQKKESRADLSGNPAASALTDIFTLKSSDFTDLKLRKTDDGGYAVTGRVDGSLIDEKLGSLEDLSGGVGNTDGTVEVTMIFGDNGDCRSVVYDFAPGQEDKDTDVKTYRFGIYIESYSDEKMEIPADVLKGAAGEEEAE